MNMASVCILFIFIFMCISKVRTDILKCKAENRGEYGRPSLLECVIENPQDGAAIRVVTWKKDGRPLVVFNRGEMKLPDPDLSLAVPSWDITNTNVSLLIAKTAVEHEGLYECTVMTELGHSKQSTRLKVTAKYNKPTVRSTTETRSRTGDKARVTLTCESGGGYPKGRLRWFDEDDVELTNDCETEVNATGSGLFLLSRKLIVGKGSSSSKYTCKVFNASEGKEEETSFETPNPSPKPEGQGGERNEPDLVTKVAAPMVVIGSLIAGLLLALLIYRRRSRPEHHGVPAYEPDDCDGDRQELDHVA